MEKYQSLIKCTSCSAEVTAVVTAGEPLQSQSPLLPSQERIQYHQFSRFPSPLSLRLGVSAKETQAGGIKDIYISLTVLKGLLSLPYHAPFM